MASTWELLELAERMGLEGPEFRAWYEERMAREREERAAERKAMKEKLRAKIEQLEVQRRALERRLEVARGGSWRRHHRGSSAEMHGSKAAAAAEEEKLSPKRDIGLRPSAVMANAGGSEEGECHADSFSPS
ncbi:hypothetical protein HPB52_001107 [Rhipicephalus sanguineus]|uniref:Uncharacterized protein n=1 Tax=Rhipicephalus sanguineus TaxID=34632 RepID=A0A9D4T8D2_RHISA|nr:hypothetical protein HPB52_001107 [Rhipicephalus sanguineus]